jgi:hypothetical protein
MLVTYADSPLTTQLTVKRDFVHSEIGAGADLRMDKVELSSQRRRRLRRKLRNYIKESAVSPKAIVIQIFQILDGHPIISYLCEFPAFDCEGGAPPEETASAKS